MSPSSTRPTQPATDAAPAQAGPLRWTATGPALVGPLLIAAAELLSPIDTSADTSAERLADILDQPGRYRLTVTCLLAGMLLLVPAVLAAQRSADRVNARLARTAAVIAAAGFVFFCVNIGAIGIGPTAWASLPAEAQEQTEAAFTAIDEGKGLMPVPIAGSFLLPLVGLTMLAAALWRGGRVPRWSAAALPLGGALFLLGPDHAVRAAGAIVLLTGLVPTTRRSEPLPS